MQTLRSCGGTAQGAENGARPPGAARPFLNRALLCRYDRPGPRYTSYPTADRFTDAFGAADYREALAGSNGAEAPISLYVHLPFCRTLCLFCGCNVIWTKDRSRNPPYVDLLEREMDLVTEAIGRGRRIWQLHWGGGTPTHARAADLRRLFAAIRSRFSLEPDAEIGVEINPRELDTDHIGTLAELGFNRASLGLQDSNPEVQRAVRRIQPADLTRLVLEQCRSAGFRSINLDLIYGLPFQTTVSFDRTLDDVIGMAPDRIALFNFAYLPRTFTHQRAIPAEALPSAELKLDILEVAVARLTDAGYVYIGMDHFARPGDELAVAQRERTLGRNFQGYTTRASCDLIALGVSAISQAGDCYAQNRKDLAGYRAALAEGLLPTARGAKLQGDDALRRDVIQRITAHLEVVKAEVEAAHGIDFDRHFAASLRALAPAAADGLVELRPDRLTVTPAGRLLLRNIAMCFDAYLDRPAATTYSKTV